MVLLLAARLAPHQADVAQGKRGFARISHCSIAAGRRTAVLASLRQPLAPGALPAAGTRLVLGGICFVALGLGVSVLARVWLGGNWSGTVTLNQVHELIRTGPYRFVRHPIYTGLLLAVLGSAIAENEWRGLLGFAVIVLAFVHKLGIEERFLTQQFGDSYTRYRQEVPALIPGFRW